MRIRIIDAFTDRPFGGNPAAVCLLDDTDTWPDEAWMQQVAAEMHLADSAFAHPLSDGGEADWALRWFTPEVETNLCGHATLATAYAMYRDRGGPSTIGLPAAAAFSSLTPPTTGRSRSTSPPRRRPRSPRPMALRQRSASPRGPRSRLAPSATSSLCSTTKRPSARSPRTSARSLALPAATASAAPS